MLPVSKKKVPGQILTESEKKVQGQIHTGIEKKLPGQIIAGSENQPPITGRILIYKILTGFSEPYLH